MTARTFGSVCSGIEAASLAFGPLGWNAAWFSEIEPFPSAVLAHHYPEVPNLGDMTTLPERVRSGEAEAPDMLCGGTPCQAFSVAGNRESLSDARGNLTLTFCELADAIDDVRSARGGDPCVVFWENVPGVLSTADNAFGCFLGALVGAGAALVPSRNQRWTDAGVVAGPRRVAAWRVLDAQFFGLAQRRRRVFVVAGAGAGFDPAAVLLERQGVHGHPAASRRAGQDAAAGAGVSTAVGSGRGWWDQSDVGATIRAQDSVTKADTLVAYGGNNTAGPINVATAVRAKGGTGHGDCESETFIAFAPEVASTLVGRSSRGGGQTNSPGHNADQQIVAFNARQDPDSWTERTGPLDTDGSTQAVAFNWQQGGGPTTSLPLEVEKTPTLQRSQSVAVHTTSAVRRLTPVECERLQGFPDNFTRIPWRGRPAEECPDGPRYKAIGNSWAVDCVAWIAERLDAALEAA